MKMNMKMWVRISPFSVVTGSVQSLMWSKRTFLRNPLFFIEKYLGTGWSPSE